MYEDTPDVPATPELSLDTSMLSNVDGYSRHEVTPPSPTPPPPRMEQVTAYRPRSLKLVKKHLSNGAVQLPLAPISQPLGAKDANAPGPVRKSSKGYKPRSKAKEVEPKSTSLTDCTAQIPYKAVQSYHPRHSPTIVQLGSGRARSRPTLTTKTSSFLGSSMLSARRHDAFAAARRKLEGVGSADEQTDRSSGTDADERGSNLLESAGGADFIE